MTSMINNVINEIDSTSVLKKDAEINMKLQGIFADSVKFIERNQICEVELWKKFVDQFRIQIDGINGIWRCEYWGKMMRGASMILSYTKDDGIYALIEASVRDMMTTQEENGRFSTYTLDTEFTSWDLWGRKYVMLGFMYFLEICRDEKLAETIVDALRRHADYIVERVGYGKIEICKASRHWKGLNSCSILEPMVRLYRMTGDKKYLDFAEYIISTGFIDGGNIIELAYENNVAPHEYPVVKAYEMMSCFEGLLQYYRITGNEKYKTAALNLGYRIIEGELSIIGCSGCTHELFDHTAVRQTQTDYKGVVQETCVVVTWMKFAEALLEISGDPIFADAIEQGFYNCYLGSFNTHRTLIRRYPRVKDLPQVMPFDSYSPLVANKRGMDIGGYNNFPDGTFYGCCACIGGAGSGIIPTYALLRADDGIALNFYEKGRIVTKTPDGKELILNIDTAYPADGKVAIKLELADAESFEIKLRIPSWCKNATVTYDGKSVKAEYGYFTASKNWNGSNEIILNLEMPVVKVLPPDGAVNADIFAAYKKGPIVLAADARICDPESKIDIPCGENGVVKSSNALCPEIPDAIMCVELTDTDGKSVRLIDYASAGKTWSNESKCAAWLYRVTL